MRYSVQKGGEGEEMTGRRLLAPGNGKYPHLQGYPDLQDAKATLKKVLELYTHVEMEEA